MVVLTIEQAQRINRTIDSLESKTITLDEQYKKLNIIKDSISTTFNKNYVTLKDSLSVKNDESINYRILFEQSVKDMADRNVKFNSQIKVARNQHSVDQVTIGAVTFLVFFLFAKTYSIH
jgi:hypothetical protein